MTKNVSDIEKAFELFWGLAPKGSLKHKKGEDIKKFIRQQITELIETLDADIYEIEGWKKKVLG